MAAIPTIIHIGDRQLDGPYQSTEALMTTLSLGATDTWHANPQFWLAIASDPRLVRAVPPPIAGAQIVEYTTAAFQCWWEGHLNVGLGTTGYWTPYNSSPGKMTLSGTPILTGGSAWYNGTSPNGPGRGCGSDVSYMRGFYEIYGSSPYFRAFKFRGSAGGFTNAAGFQSGGTAVGECLAEYALASAAAVTGGNTLDPVCIILDASAYDIANWDTASATYHDDLTAAIAYVRSAFSAPNAKVLLISHDSGFYAYSQPNAAIEARAINLLVSTELDDVRVVDMQGEVLAPEVSNYELLPADFDPGYYSVQGYINQGEKIAAIFDRMVNTPEVSFGIGLPVYALFGDSQAVGEVSATYNSESRAATILGPASTNTRTGELVWNNVNQLIETYHPLSNANTAGGIFTTSGPENRLMTKLKEAHPDGFLLVKYAIGGTSVNNDTYPTLNWKKTAAQQYSLAGAVWIAALGAVATQTGIRKVPDVRGLFFITGDNDAAGTGVSTFQADLTQLISDFRSDMTTRTDGSTLPVVLLRPMPHSALGSDADRETIRSAIVAISESVDAVGYVDTDDLELDRDDNIHYTNDAFIAIGERMADAMATLISGEESGGSSTTFLVPESLAVEDGTGLAGADSYASVAEANTYIGNRTNTTAWNEATESDRSTALRIATDYIDQQYGMRFVGKRGSATQGLEWPRTGAYDFSGNAIGTTTVPAKLKAATIEAALRVIGGTSLLPDISAGQGEVASATIGGMSISYTGATTLLPEFPAITKILRVGGLIPDTRQAIR